MPVTSQEIREILMTHDVEFQQLVQEHSRYDSQLEQLHRQPYLSSEDLTLEITLKKMKLRVKDQMEQIVALRRQEVVVRR